jgi:hypothetical protein
MVRRVPFVSCRPHTGHSPDDRHATAIGSRTYRSAYDRVNVPAAAGRRQHASPPAARHRHIMVTLIGVVGGAAYGHMMAVSDGKPLLSVGGLPRGALTGVVITGVLSSFEQVLARPAMAPLRQTPFLVHLAIKTVIYLAVILFGLVIGAWLFPTPAEIGVWLPIQRWDVLFSFAAV